MKRLFVILILGLSFIAAATAQADKVRRFSDDKIIDGKITGMTADAITIERGGVEDKIDVGDINTLTFEGEPAQFKEARDLIDSAQNEDALKVLMTVKDNSLSSEYMKTERDYMIVLSGTNIALSGGNISLDKALENMKKFLAKNQTYFRFYEIQLLCGNVCVQMKRSDDALKAYGEVVKAKGSPALKARGLAGAGQVFLAQGEASKAEKMFKDVQTIVNGGDLKGDLHKEMDIASRLGLARVLVLEEKYDDAMKLVQKVFEGISPDDAVTNANAYNTMALCYKAQRGRAKDAVIAFMHTHLLYNRDPSLHQEALDNMILLWRNDLKNESRARELEEVRRSIYGR